MSAGVGWGLAKAGAGYGGFFLACMVIAYIVGRALQVLGHEGPTVQLLDRIIAISRRLLIVAAALLALGVVIAVIGAFTG